MTSGSSAALVTAGGPLLPLLDRCGTDPARTEREDHRLCPLRDGVAPRALRGGVGLASGGCAVHDEDRGSVLGC
jgi:hypothetical protein